jgi:hypothetical protein
VRYKTEVYEALLMFGSEQINEATDWLKAEPGRRIEITWGADFQVDFWGVEGSGLAAQGNAPKLLDALKAALAGLAK